MRFDDRSVVIVVDGELDLATHDRLETAIAAQLAAGCNRFVVDLGATTFIGSSCIVPGAGHYWMNDPIDEPGSYGSVLAPRLMRFLAEKL
jgi:hypothetical protein